MDALNFERVASQFFLDLGEHKKMVLATSAHSRTTARMMSCLVKDFKIYMQTDSTFLKYQQIKENPQVALCADNIQIEGVAGIKGHPLQESNRWFAESFQRHYPSSYEKYTHLGNEVVIEVEPSYLTLWCYESEKPYRIFVDFLRRTANREDYETK